MDLTADERACLTAIGDVQEEIGEGRAPDTEAVGNRMVALHRATGRPFMLHLRPPWFGTRDAAEALERRGLIDIDPGMASFVGPGQSTPTVERLFLVLTATGLSTYRALI